MIEPLREVAVLTLVRAPAPTAGDRVAALERYDLYRRALAEDLGLDPSEDAAAVQAELLRGDAPSMSARSTSRRPRPDFALLPFVGRSAELTLLLSVLASGGDALLAGASGTGKSRLLAELATRTPVLTIGAILPETRRTVEPAAQRAAGNPRPGRHGRNASARTDQIRGGLAAARNSSHCWTASGSSRTRRAAARCCWRRRPGMLAAGGAGLVVDDLQWADASSLWILEAVLPRLVDVGAVLAYRPDELVPGDAASTFVTRARANVTVIELHPLDVNDIAELSADDDADRRADVSHRPHADSR